MVFFKFLAEVDFSEEYDVRLSGIRILAMGEAHFRDTQLPSSGYL